MIILVGFVCSLVLLQAPASPVLGGPALRIIRVADSPWRLASLPRDVAADFLAKDGYRIEWQFYQNPATLESAFISGQSDLALLAPDQVANIDAQGGQVRLLTVSWGALDWVFVSSTRVKTLSDLVGKVVGISQPGQESEFLVTRLLSTHGVDPKRVSYTAIGGTPARATSLLAGRIDATWLGYDAAYTVLQNKNFKILDGITVGQAFPDFMDLSWSATVPFIKANPQAHLRCRQGANSCQPMGHQQDCIPRSNDALV